MKVQSTSTTKRGTKDKRWLLLLCLLTFIGTGCDTQPAHGTTNTKTTPTTIPTIQSLPTAKAFPNAKTIDAYLKHLQIDGTLSGSVLVATNGMIFEKGYGWADKDTRILNTTRTRFRLGSISKSFTAMAILILQERGKLRVQDYLCTYISDCPTDWQPITLEQLLTHSSGIPDYTNFINFVPTWTRPTTPAMLIERFKDMPVEFSPGSRFRYSSSGYVLLGYIIERLTGESYATFLQTNIFAPLKMDNTGYDSQYPALPQHATGYYSGYIKPDAYDPSVLYAAGALYSTVQDLNIWDQALLTHRLISQQTLATMLTSHIACPSSGSGGCLLHTDLGYGDGWFIGTEPQGKLVYHVGHIDGFLTYNGIYPKLGLIVVVLSNLETTNVLKIGLTLASMVV